MSEVEDVTLNLSELVHDLFIETQYKVWRERLTGQQKNRWFSLIVELDKANCATEEVKSLGEEIYSKLVYRCIPAPEKSDMDKIMVLFNVATWNWHDLVHFSEPLKSN